MPFLRLEPRWALLGLLALAGCAGRQPGLLEEIEERPTRVSIEVLREHAEAAWEGRADKERLLEAILLYKHIHLAEPKARAPLVRLARAYYLLADGHLILPGEQRLKFDQGAFYGERALALNGGLRASVKAGKALAETMVSIGADDLEAALWTALNLTRWSDLAGGRATRREAAAIAGLLERADALGDGYFYGVTRRAWGAFHAVAPGGAGGDLAKSRAAFEEAIRVAPGYFENSVQMAEIYAVRVGDRALFERLLRPVIDGDPTRLADVVPEQRVAQAHARRLLPRMEELFR